MSTSMLTRDSIEDIEEIRFRFTSPLDPIQPRDSQANKVRMHREKNVALLTKRRRTRNVERAKAGHP